VIYTNDKMVPFRYTLLSLLALHIQGSWIDPDTPEHSMKTAAMSPGDEREFELVGNSEVLLHFFLWQSSFCSLNLRSFRMNSNRTAGHFMTETILAGQH
jgi:hypothetical protein